MRPTPEERAWLQTVLPSQPPTRDQIRRAASRLRRAISTTTERREGS